MKHIIIDTDIGSDIDDALALLLAFHMRDVEILGITTVYGPTDLRAKIAYKITQAANLDIPVAAGRSEPLYSLMPVWLAGTEGEGVLNDDEKVASLESFGIDTDASNFIIEAILENPDQITLVALGALTNIALAFEKEPLIRDVLQEVVFMGSGLTYPLQLPSTISEDEVYRARHSHNILCDMKAAKQVIDSGVPMRIVTNDLTSQYWLEGEVIERFNEAKTFHVALVGKMLDVWLKYRSEMFGLPIVGTCPHDPLTVAVALDRVQYQGVSGDLTIDFDDAGTEFTLNSESPIELVIREEGSSFMDWLSKHLHEPEV